MSLLFGTGAIAGSAAKGAPGMVLLTPTSIAHSGTSASIGANGQVTFTAVTSLSLNGVFSADFDNYVIAIRHIAGGNGSYSIRLRTSGSDASGTDYTKQSLSANSTTVSAERNSSQTEAGMGLIGTTASSGDELYIYGPFLSQPTAMRSVTAAGRDSARIRDDAATHSLSTSYDGITFIPNQTLSGAVAVYGVRS